MKDFVITCSSTCDLAPYYLRKHSIYYVSFFYYLEDKKYYDDFYKEHSIDYFYNKIKTCDVKTSQPDPSQYKELWIKLIDQGYDILHIELSSGISGAVNSALIAKSMVEDINKTAKIYVVDSLCCSTGYGLLINNAIKEKEKGKSIEEVRDYAESEKYDINHIFMISNLDQLIKGGRISMLAGSIGKLLNIVPILHVDENGKLEVLKKVRGINSAIDEIVNMSKENICGGENTTSDIFYCNSNNYDICKKLYDKCQETYKNVVHNEENIFNVGTVIGAHTGEGAVSIFYVGDGRI